MIISIRITVLSLIAFTLFSLYFFSKPISSLHLYPLPQIPINNTSLNNTSLNNTSLDNTSLDNTPLKISLSQIPINNASVCSYHRVPPLGINQDQGHVCIIIRTFWGHTPDEKNGYKPGEFSLPGLLDCLEQFEYQDWSAYIFALDDIPAPGIETVINSRLDFFKPRYHLVDTPYHYRWECYTDCGYSATDYSIYNHCPPETRWFLVTNGDNEYHPHFLSYLDKDYDVVGFDWFSRYAVPANSIGPEELKGYNRKPMGSVCEDLVNPSCMNNLYYWRRNELGAQVWNYERFLKEDRKYSKFSPGGNNDGELANDLVHLSGWKVKHEPNCYCSHSPNNWANCQHKHKNGAKNIV